MKIKQLSLVSIILSISLVVSGQINPQKTSSTKHTYAENSVLAQGNFYKIKIKDSGVYMLTYADLISMGINNPADVRVFGYGGAVLEQSFLLPKIDDLPEVAIWMEKGDDGIFNAGDYILFYGQGTVSWSYDEKNHIFTHRTNTYSNYGYYFVTSDAGEGLRIEEKSMVLPANILPNEVNTFTDYDVHEKELVSLVNGGKEFYGECFDNVTTYNFPFHFPDIVQEPDAVKVQLDVVGASYYRSSFSFGLQEKQNINITIPANSSTTKGRSVLKYCSFTPNSDQLEFNLTYNKPNELSKGYLNYIVVNARRKLSMVGTVMPFHNTEHIGESSFNRYSLDKANSKIQIWDITDPIRISRLPIVSNGDEIRFVDEAKTIRSYLAVNPGAVTDFAKPILVGVVSNQNIHSIRQADMVIITHADFISPAETLAETHRQKDGMTVSVLTTEQVYNEFSSGTPDATAYRWVMKMLYDRALDTNNTSQLPKYLLLVGKGSFDNRQILEDSGYNYVLTYQADNSLSETDAYVTDDYFTFLDNDEGLNVERATMDIAVGRLPVTTVQQATDVINKTIRYMEDGEKGLWKSKLCFVADDGDDNIHMKMADKLANSVAQQIPSLHVDKVYIDDYPKEIGEFEESSPMTKEKILSLLDSGLFYLNYMGHSSNYAWAFEKILTDKDIVALDNRYLPLWICATSSFIAFDSKIVSAGEQVLLNHKGGGFGAFGPTRLTYAHPNEQLNTYLLDNLFSKQKEDNLTIGEAIRRAKNSLGGQTNKLCYVYMGDPAVRLNYADKNKVLTNAINNNTEFGNDTIRANSSNRISGSIVDEEGAIRNNFNGSVYVSIYDKPQTIVTRNNDNWHRGPFEYENRPLLLSETAEVKNGTFEYAFTMPKDIDENFGSGYVRYYAHDEKQHMEAMGYFDNFIIGGVQKDTGLETIEDLSDEISVTNYPNPAREHIIFQINNSTIRSFVVEVFDLSGRSIHSLTSANQNRIEWNLATNNGQKLGTGTYFYKARIVTSDGETISKSNKFIVSD